MAINTKKYTKDQMAKMVKEAQEKSAALEAEITALKNCIDEKNDLIAEYANLKAAMQRKNVALTEQLDQIPRALAHAVKQLSHTRSRPSRRPHRSCRPQQRFYPDAYSMYG